MIKECLLLITCSLAGRTKVNIVMWSSYQIQNQYTCHHHIHVKKVFGEKFGYHMKSSTGKSDRSFDSQSKIRVSF